MTSLSRAALAAACLMGLCVTPTYRADEGMWLFNKLPTDYLDKTHKFKVEKDWLENVQKSSVRFNSGGSGSFVSPDGLVITNHHVASDALHKLGTEKRNIYRDGYHAKTRDDELKCEAMELNVLMDIRDVTAEVNKAVPAGTAPEKAAELRRAAVARIEKDAKDKTKLQPQVVTLYQGGAYHLYLFKKYTDVRLVFAPEGDIAFFGGDPDNFEYPRYDLDITLFRVYEDDKPVKVKNYLKWSKTPLKEGDLIFVSGHPGRTQRLSTVAELEYLRDHDYPFRLNRLRRLEVLLGAYSGRSEENKRKAKDLLFSVQNSRKARLGGQAALLDPKLMDAKKAEQKRLQAAAAKDEKLAGYKDVWDRIKKAQDVRKKNERKYITLEGGAAFFSELFTIARHLVRAAEERPKPNADRLREYGEARLESLTEQLFSKEPIYDDFEVLKLADSLTFLIEELGVNNALVKKVMNGKSPIDRARELIKGTKLKDVAVRKELYEGGKKLIETSKDPMILLAKLVDEDSRAVRKVMESQVDEVSRQAYGDLAKIKFAVDGDKVYPDATFTLRLAYGLVKGYEEDGKKVPFTTTFEGLYARSAEHKNKEPFELPKSWVKNKDKLDLKTPFNFVSTADIIGGNSGSPVLNRAGEFVGIIFDGNIQSLRLNFAYDDVEARATSVDAQGIIEALRKIYGADALADEMAGKKSEPGGR